LSFSRINARSNYFADCRIKSSLIRGHVGACCIDSCLMIAVQLGAIGTGVYTIDPVRWILFREVFKKI